VEPIDLADVRRYRAWVANADLVFPILDAIEQAPPDEKKVRLFWGACRIREIADERGLSLKRLSRSSSPRPAGSALARERRWPSRPCSGSHTFPAQRNDEPPPLACPTSC
jgi:hypothetical protein